MVLHCLHHRTIFAGGWFRKKNLMTFLANHGRVWEMVLLDLIDKNNAQIAIQNGQTFTNAVKDGLQLAMASGQLDVQRFQLFDFRSGLLKKTDFGIADPLKVNIFVFGFAVHKGGLKCVPVNGFNFSGAISLRIGHHAQILSGIH